MNQGRPPGLTYDLGAPQPTWHIQEINALVSLLCTSLETGLSHEVAQQHLHRYGMNKLPDPQRRSGWAIFLAYFQSGPVALLLVAAMLSIATGGIVDAMVILGVVLINAGLGYITESRSEQTIQSLQNIQPHVAWIVRDGEILQMPSEHVVPGDLLVLKPGSYIAADARLISVQQLTIDESALTGESRSVTKQSLHLDEAATPLDRRVNMVYMGTFVTGGEGVAVVVATGSQTEMGRIQSLVDRTIVPQTVMESSLIKRVVNLSGSPRVFAPLFSRSGFGVATVCWRC